MTVQTSTPDTLSVIRHGLQRRHLRQILSRTDDQHAAMTHLAAHTFMPIDGGLAFTSPVVPLGRVALVTLNWIKLSRGDGTDRYVAFLRSHRARFASRTATTHWDESGAQFSCNLARPINRWSWCGGSPKNPLSAWRIGLDLDREIERRMHHRFEICGMAVLPPTLIAVPCNTAVTPEATPMTMARAFNDRIPWQEAWRRLRRELRVDNALCPPGFDLIDTRLVTQVPKTSSVHGVVYHDLRGLLGRMVYNPRRDGSLPPGLSKEGIVTAMRARLAPDIAPFSHDADLLAAAADPAEPMRIRGLSHVQVWWPARENLAPGSFVTRDFGQRADLAGIPAEWLKQLRLPRHRPIESPTGSTTAA